MTKALDIRDAQTISSAAADWVVRLRAPDAGEAEWMAFDAWLEAAPGHRAAFDAAETLWAEFGARADEIAEALEDTAPTPSRRRWGAGAFSAFAAVAAIALISPFAAGLLPAHADSYITAKGQRRTVQLADGTRIDLNSGSSISVRMSRGKREVTMNDAEVAFDVTHDAARPFYIHVGDQTVRVVGTQFDIAHRDGQISVTVRRGVVQVTPRSGGEPVSLTVGQQLRHHDGDDNSTVSAVPADDAFAWREGRMVCRDESLPTVVAELNRHFPQPVRLEGDRVDSMRFSGVLTLDDESSTINRLSALLPLSATRSESVIVLQSRDRTR